MTERLLEKGDLYVSRSTYHMTERLLERDDLDLNKTDANGITPLMCAAQYRGRALSRLLSIGDVDLNHVNADGKTALCFAANFGSVSQFNALLVHGANPIVGHPLFIAIKAHNFRIVEMFCKLGISLQCKNDDNETPLMAAFAARDAAIVEQLLVAGCKLESLGCFDFTTLLRRVLCDLTFRCVGDKEGKERGVVDGSAIFDALFNYQSVHDVTKIGTPEQTLVQHDKVKRLQLVF